MGKPWTGAKTAAVVGGLTAGIFGGPFLLIAGAGFIWTTFIKPDPQKTKAAEKAKETKGAWKLGAMVAGGTMLGQAAILALASSPSEVGMEAAGMAAAAIGVVAGVAITKNIVTKLLEKRRGNPQERGSGRSPGK